MFRLRPLKFLFQTQLRSHSRYLVLILALGYIRLLNDTEIDRIQDPVKSVVRNIRYIEQHNLVNCIPHIVHEWQNKELMI